MQKPWNYQSRLRPCFNCGQQYERDSVCCTTCGAKRGVSCIQQDGAVKDTARYITLKESRPPHFGLLEDSVRNRILNVFQMFMELMKDSINEYWLLHKRRNGPVKGPTTERIDLNPSLGDLYRLHLSTGRTKPRSLPDIAERVPDLDYIGAFFYEDLVRNSRPTDLESWRSSIEKADTQLVQLIQPYMEEVYCRGKAVFIGAELRASGVWRFEKWRSCLLAQLSPGERTVIAQFARQIYQRVKDIMRDNTGSKGGIQVTTRQRRVIMAGLGLVLLMLLVPPWKSSLGSRRGYGFIVGPPRGAASIDLSRLFVQTLFIVLLTGGVVFVLQNREK